MAHSCACCPEPATPATLSAVPRVKPVTVGCQAKRPARASRVLLFAVVAAATIMLVQVVYAQAGAAAGNGCKWSGWHEDSLRRSALASPAFRPGERVTVALGVRCGGVGTDGAISEDAWIMTQGNRTSRLHGDGFSILSGQDAKSFTIVISDDAAPGPRMIYSMQFVNGRASVTEMPFGVKEADSENTVGFCCREPGSACIEFTNEKSEAGKSDINYALAQCGDGNSFVSDGTEYDNDAQKNLCDYACDAPVVCYVRRGTSPGGCSTIRRSECARASGESFAGSQKECLAHSATGGNQYRHYCDPSGKSDVGMGICRRVAPSKSGAYAPADAGGFKYDHPGPGEYDTYTSSEADCTETCGNFYCVTVPADGKTQPGCTSMPVRIDPGHAGLCASYNETGNPSDPLKVKTGESTYLYPSFCPPSAGAAAYRRRHFPPGVAGSDGSFKTVEECGAACKL